MSSSAPVLAGEDFIACLVERSPSCVARTFTAEQLDAIRQTFAAGGYSAASVDAQQAVDTAKIEHPTSKAVRSSSTPPHDRRRPGRINNLYPTLVSLFRHPVVVIDAEQDEGDLRPTLGIATAVFVGLFVWIPVMIALSLAFLWLKGKI